MSQAPATFKVVQKVHAAWREQSEQRINVQVLEFSAWLVENIVEDCVEHCLVRARESPEGRAGQAPGVAYLDPPSLEFYFARDYLGLPQAAAREAATEVAQADLSKVEAQ